MSAAVSVTPNGHLLEITLNRPKANAIDTATSTALYEALIIFDQTPEYRVAIITGTGEKFFSAGWDLTADEDPTAQYSPGGFAGITEFFDLSKPVICAVNGMAVGGGFELALACDLIVAAEHAQFFLPEANIGLVPDAGGVLRLPKALPKHIANEMLYTGKRLSALDAERFGLVNKVVPLDQLMAAARELAGDVAYAAPLSIKAIKEITRNTTSLTVEEGFALLKSGTLHHYETFLNSEDIHEGTRAFNEKREPVWKGK
jgi:crotonobetainyl-CoA hydratase